MFDFSFWELSLVGLITLVVVGPDKIPSLARKTGVYAGKLKKFLNKIKADIDNELNLEELKELKELSLKGQSNHLNDFFENSQEASNDIENEVELIKKIGSEAVSSKGANDFDCSSEDLNLNSIRINSIRIGNIEFNSDGQTSNTISQICGGNEIINLDDKGEAIVTCKIITYRGWTSALGEFEERLTINLDYINNEIISKEIDKILIKKNLKPDKQNYEYAGLISRWTDLKVLRETWKRDLLNGERKTVNEYEQELEDKWKLDLFIEEKLKESQSSIIIENSASEPKEPYIVTPSSPSPSPLFSEVTPKHLELMRRNKRIVETICQTEQTYAD